MNNASKERGDDIITIPGQIVHDHCRRTYINPIVIKSLKRKPSEPLDKAPLLRSEKQFDFKEDCLFCGVSTNESTAKRKTFDVHAVRTTEFQQSIEQICNERNDDWAVTVKGRIEFARDLHAADAVYHKVCSINFRTNKGIPQMFSPSKTEKDQSSKGRPSKVYQDFLEVTKYLEENDDEQMTISQLVEKMRTLCGDEAYSPFYMKCKLKEHYGSSIVVTEINGKQNVVTFQQNATTILHNFYKESTTQKSEEEKKKSILKAAAAFIKNDIRSMPVNKNCYPSTDEILAAEDYVPQSILLLLRNIFSKKDSNLQVQSIGQAIVQAARPRLTIQPLQIGLAVQLHHMFGSRFLIETLNSMGFCSSYPEVQRFESSAVVARNQETSDLLDQTHFLQFVADNVDHNTDTIDGNNTFHGMGIISCTTPGKIKSPKEIPRVELSTEELLSIGHINVLHYTPDQLNSFTSMKFEKLQELRKINTTWKLDILMKIMWPLKSPMAGWSGLMQMVCTGNNPGLSNVTFLPMIDLNPSDMSCVYSTLKFVSKEASRYNRTPVITFDQPLYWKALMITCGEECKNVVVRLGAFHTEMSFLGSIGSLMSGTGLKELLELVYAPNTVTHMLSGKAVSRSVRGFMLVDTALHCLIAEELYGISPTNEEAENIELLQSISNLNNAEQLFDSLMNKQESVEKIVDHDAMQAVEKDLEQQKMCFRQSRTSCLWLSFCEMVGILKRFLLAERTGDWELHLTSVQEMLPYLAASGHNLYTKSAYIYLSQMQNLRTTHPQVHAFFLQGNHVVRRSDRFWAGLSTDLIIEQVLMRSIKSTGGLTRGRGMGEAQRTQWLLAMPVCAEYNNAMQQITGTGYKSSDQHVESTSARKEKDYKDILTLYEFLKERSPFTADKSLRNIETGMIANDEANVDSAKDIGNKILASMTEQLVTNYSFKKKNQAVALDAKRPTNTNIVQTTQVDPQLMFQRLTTAGQENLNNMTDLFKYELSSFPSSLFESNGFLRQAAKSTLADAIWNSGTCNAAELPTSNVAHVIDGGSLLHRVPWTKGETFSQICSKYVDHVKRKFVTPTVVLDGYENHSTKDITHMRRSKGVVSNTVTFTKDMPLRVKKETFLANDANKNRFVSLLKDSLNNHGIEAIQAEGDADLLIVQTAVAKSNETKTVVFGEDTDLLVLLCHHARQNQNEIFFTTDKQITLKAHKIWDISKTKTVLGEDLCYQLPFIHALTGCDTTSRLFGIGKPFALKKIKSDEYLQEQAQIFMSANMTKDVIIKAGEEALVSLYGGIPLEGLDLLRWRKFTAKTMSVSRVTGVQVQSLPPTSNAAQFHSLRVYLQCQYWLDKTVEDLNPKEWGWTIRKDTLFPKEMSQQPAPDFLLNIIHCNCKTDCDTRKCGCRKNGLSCSNGCGSCRGINCSNSQQIAEDDLNDDE